MLKNIWLAFIAVFVAVDAVGVLPIFVSLTEAPGAKERTKIIVQSVFTALCLAIGFILLCEAVFRGLGIMVSDFMVAGGAMLSCLAIVDIVNPVKRHWLPNSELGAVPLGTPLYTGSRGTYNLYDGDFTLWASGNINICGGRRSLRWLGFQVIRRCHKSVGRGGLKKLF